MFEIIEDQTLPGLETVTDAGKMRREFERFFQREYPGMDLQVDHCDIDRVYHKPGKKCQITYRLKGQKGRQQPFDQWFFAEMHQKDARKKLAKLQPPASWPGCDFWKPLSVMEAYNLLLYAFPYNPVMPFLHNLVDAGFVKQQAGKHLSGFGLSADWRCERVGIEKVKYRFGKSCVMRYHATFRHHDGRNHDITFYNKSYASDLSRYVHRVLTAIAGTPEYRNNALTIPASIAHIDATNSLWQWEWRGDRMRDLGESDGWDTLADRGMYERIAAMLAALHRLPVDKSVLASGPSLAEVAAEGRDNAGKICQYLPEKQAQLREILQAYDQPAAPDAGSRECLIHGTFKIAQILCRESEVALVDFDSVAWGDPLYDVAEFIASLEFLRVSDNAPAETIKRSIALFLDAYRRSVPWSIDRQLLALYTLTFLLGKLHSALKRGDDLSNRAFLLAFDMIENWSNVANV